MTSKVGHRSPLDAIVTPSSRAECLEDISLLYSRSARQILCHVESRRMMTKSESFCSMSYIAVLEICRNHTRRMLSFFYVIHARNFEVTGVTPYIYYTMNHDREREWGERWGTEKGVQHCPEKILHFIKQSTTWAYSLSHIERISSTDCSLDSVMRLFKEA